MVIIFKLIKSQLSYFGDTFQDHRFVRVTIYLEEFLNRSHGSIVTINLEEFLNRFHSNVVVSVMLKCVTIRLEEILDRFHFNVNVSVMLRSCHH